MTKYRLWFERVDHRKPIYENCKNITFLGDCIFVRFQISQSLPKLSAAVRLSGQMESFTFIYSLLDAFKK